MFDIYKYISIKNSNLYILWYLSDSLELLIFSQENEQKKILQVPLLNLLKQAQHQRLEEL